MRFRAWECIEVVMGNKENIFVDCGCEQVWLKGKIIKLDINKIRDGKAVFDV